MKHKILVTGTSNIVIDFLKHTSSYFTSLGTTAYVKDVMLHFKLFKPDAFLIFIDEKSADLISVAEKVKQHFSYNEEPIIIVSNSDLYDEVRKKNLSNADLIVKRPISPDNLSLRIERLLEEKEADNNIVEAEVSEAQKNETETVENNPVQTAARKHILVVDDERSILKMLKAALEDQYDITTIVNGVMTEKIIEAKKVDLIILDYEMPIKTGAEVFKSLKSHPIGKNIPVCFLTGVAERSKIEEIMALRPHGYLLKPINMDMFLSTVSNLLS